MEHFVHFTAQDFVHLIKYYVLVTKKTLMDVKAKQLAIIEQKIGTANIAQTLLIALHFACQTK